MRSKQKKGNALFIILIAVALFAALTYTVSSGSRSQAPQQKENLKLATSQLLYFANQIKSGVDRLRFSDCDDDQIDFANTVWHFMDSETNYIIPSGHNPNAPTDHYCALFRPEGMGIPILDFPDAVVPDSNVSGTTYKPGSGRIITGAVANLGLESEPELIFQINYITENVCRLINEEFVILSGIPEEDPSGTFADFNGVFPSSVPIYIGSGTSASLAGKESFCYQENPSSGSSLPAYHFNQVLIIR